jgi:nicotinic acid phosphoribosyltransferase
MGNFFFNMWLYQTLFSHDNRPQWNEQNGARPVVKVKDPEKNEDYEIWKNQWSTENVAFGMGGGLLQKLDRDTFKFAMKASYAKVGNEEILVYKEPITDHTKISKKGKLALVETMDGYETVMQGSKWYDRDVLETVFENGKIVKEYTFEEVRKNVAY